MAEPATPVLRHVAVAGLGSVGMRVARALDAGIPGLTLVTASANDRDGARERVRGFTRPPEIVALDALPGTADLVVECLPPDLFRTIAEPVLAGGGTLVAASVGALLSNDDLPALAARAGGRILAPSGALAGLDALAAGAEAGLEEVRLVTRKPPLALGTEVETDDGIRATTDLTQPLRIFAGTAREAVQRFPKNVNVAATISLAGLGPDRTMVEVWADPAIAANQHELALRSTAGAVRVVALNCSEPNNPKSSAITGHSIVAALRRLAAPVVIGS